MAVFVQSNTTHGPLSEQMAAEQGPGKAAPSNIDKKYACPSPSPPSLHVATMTTLGHFGPLQCIGPLWSISVTLGDLCHFALLWVIWVTFGHS